MTFFLLHSIFNILFKHLSYLSFSFNKTLLMEYFNIIIYIYIKKKITMIIILIKRNKMRI